MRIYLTSSINHLLRKALQCKCSSIRLGETHRRDHARSQSDVFRKRRLMNAVLSALGRAHELARLLADDVVMSNNTAVRRCRLLRLQLGEGPLMRGILLVAENYYIVGCGTS